MSEQYWRTHPTMAWPHGRILRIDAGQVQVRDGAGPGAPSQDSPHHPPSPSASIPPNQRGALSHVSNDSQRLAQAYRILADTALVVGLAALGVAIALHVEGTNTALSLALYATTAITGLIAVAAAIQRDRYRSRGAPETTYPARSG